MQEFMLFVKTKGDHLAELSQEEQQFHVEKIGKYIGELMEKGQMKGAQPLEMAGQTISGSQGVFKDGALNETAEVIAGYFHILAKDLEEAVSIAKANPIFEQGQATIEVRPIKQMQGIN